MRPWYKTGSGLWWTADDLAHLPDGTKITRWKARRLPASRLRYWWWHTGLRLLLRRWFL